MAGGLTQLLSVLFMKFRLFHVNFILKIETLISEFQLYQIFKLETWSSLLVALILFQINLLRKKYFD